MINLSRVASQLEQLIRELPAEPVRLLCESLRVSAYKHALAPPPPNTRPVQRDFSATFGEVASWLTALSEGYAAAVEVGLDVLAALHPRKGKTIAVAILHEGGWRELAVRACILLSKLDDEAAFGAILNVLDTTPRAGFLLAQSPYANGCASVFARLQAVELSETSRAHMLSYLGAKGCGEARGLLVDRLASSPDRKECLAAGHALLALGDNDSLDSLAAELASPEPILRLLAARAAISLDPKTVVDRIGEERLRQQDASGIAEALFKALRDQIKGDGPYWHRADPGWDALFAHWAGTKGPVGGLAQQLLQISDGAPPTLPVDVRVVTTTSSLSPGARLKRWQRDGVAAWAEIRELDPLVRDAEAVQVLRELMARARQRIERVVERLDAIGYQSGSKRGICFPPVFCVLVLPWQKN